MHASRLRRSCAAEIRRIQYIQIQGKIHRGTLQPFHGFLQSLEVKPVHVGMRLGKGKLLPISAADTKLVNVSVPYQFMTPRLHAPPQA